jgi:hypothetical protein
MWKRVGRGPVRLPGESRREQEALLRAERTLSAADHDESERQGRVMVESAATLFADLSAHSATPRVAGWRRTLLPNLELHLGTPVVVPHPEHDTHAMPTRLFVGFLDADHVADVDDLRGADDLRDADA